MKTITMFSDFEYTHNVGHFTIYKADTTYRVEDEVAERINRCGAGEIVPDEILNEPDDDDFEPMLETKPKRRKVSRKWQ